VCLGESRLHSDFSDRGSAGAATCEQLLVPHSVETAAGRSFPKKENEVRIAFSGGPSNLRGLCAASCRSMSIFRDRLGAFPESRDGGRYFESAEQLAIRRSTAGNASAPTQTPLELRASWWRAVLLGSSFSTRGEQVLTLRRERKQTHSW